jgi:hypothetical protein
MATVAVLCGSPCATTSTAFLGMIDAGVVIPPAMAMMRRA